MASMETSHELTRLLALFPAVLTTPYRGDAGEAESLHNFSSTSCKENGKSWVLEKKGLQIIWRWFLQGSRVQTEGLSWHQNISKEVNHLLPFLSKQSMRKT